jgi:hypothetical protein
MNDGTIGGQSGQQPLEVNLPRTKANAGMAGICVQIPSNLETNYMKRLTATETGRLMVGMDQIHFNEMFSNTSINRNIWREVAATSTVTQANGFLNLNANSSLGSGAYAIVQSYRYFQTYMTYATRLEMDIQFQINPVINTRVEWGYGLIATVSAPTDGVFFRVQETDRAFLAVTNYGGFEITTNLGYLEDYVTLGVTNHFTIEIHDKEVHFYINGSVVAEMTVNPGRPGVTATYDLPVVFRVYNTAVPASAMVMKVANVTVNSCDMQTGKAWRDIMVGAGNGCWQGPSNSGTYTSTALYTNSMPVAAGAAATNTTAALGSGLGGQFTLLPTLTAGLDGIISSYQNTGGTNQIQGRTLYITGVTIDGIVTTVLAGGPIYGFWSLAYGATNVSLATTDAAGTKAPRRIPLGIQTYVVTAPVGTLGQKIQVNFDTPIAVQQGEFIQTVMKNVGTVTTTGAITFLIGFQGYWE